MPTIIDDGWLEITDGADTLKLFVEGFKWKLVKSSRIMHYEGGINIHIPIFKKYVRIVAVGLWLNSNTKTDNYLAYMDSFTDSGVLTVKFKRNSTGDYQKLDGSGTSFSMMVVGDFGEVEKIANGDQEVYYVNKLILEEAS